MLGRRLSAVGIVAACVIALVPAARADIVRDKERPVLKAIGAEQAWKISKGKGVTVAVLDTGVDTGQRELKGVVRTGPDYQKENNPKGFRPPRLHGTAMASLVAGRGYGKDSGIIGMAPEAQVLSVRVIMDNEEPGYRKARSSSDYNDAPVKGIRWAADHGADVINMSLGGRRDVEGARDAVEYAVSRGALVVASAGNDGSAKRKRDPFEYPASYPGVISVAAVDGGHRKAKFSNRNAGVMIAAPGVKIPVAMDGNQHYLVDGTSPAAALVSGVAALIRARYPRLSPALVSQAIIAGAARKPKGGYSPELGYGEVFAPGALREAAKLARTQPEPGQSASRRFADDPGSVELVRRDGSTLLLSAVIVPMSAVGFVASGVVLIMLLRRRRRPGEPIQTGTSSPFVG